MATPIKVGIIGGSGFYKLESLEDKVTREGIETPFGPPSCSPVEGNLSGVAVVVLARHGLSDSLTLVISVGALGPRVAVEVLALVALGIAPCFTFYST